jgi:hypothetical protein
VSAIYVWSNGRVAYGPLLSNLRSFSDRWYNNNASLFALLTRAFGGAYQALEPARQVTLIVIVGVIGWAAAKRLEPLRAALVIIGVLLLVSPNVFPWYVLWLLPFLAFYPSAPWLYFSVAVCLGYQVLIGYEIGGRWQYNSAVLAIEYVPLYLLLAVAWLKCQLRKDKATGPA